MEFKNISEDSSAPWLSKGFQEWITTDLSKIKSINVIERGQLDKILEELKLSENEFIDKEKAARIGKGVGAKAIMLGSFAVQGNKLVISARLVHVETGIVFFGSKLEGKKDSFFKLENDLVKKVIESLSITLSKFEQLELDVPQTKSFAAFNAYSKAVTFASQNNLKETRRQLIFAASSDPNYQAVYELARKVGFLENEILRLQQSGGIILNPRNALEHYYNARTYQDMGEPQKSYNSFRLYFKRVTDHQYIDPHIHFQKMLKAGIFPNDAQSYYKNYLKTPPQDSIKLLVYSFLLNREEKIALLESIINRDKKFAPAYYMLSLLYSEEEIGYYSVPAKYKERKYGNEFYRLFKDDSIANFYYYFTINTDLRISWLDEIKERQKSWEDISAEVVYANLHGDTDRWEIHVIIMEDNVRKIETKLDSEDDPYRQLNPWDYSGSVGTTEGAGFKEIKYTTHTVYIRYQDAKGYWQGPYKVLIDPIQDRCREMQSWHREYHDLISYEKPTSKYITFSFENLLTYSDILDSIEYSMDNKQLDMRFPFLKKARPSYIENISYEDKMAQSTMVISPNVSMFYVRFSNICGWSSKIQEFNLKEIRHEIPILPR